MKPSVRVLTLDDIPAAIDLCRAAGWNQLREDWTRFVEYEPDGCFAAEINGQVVGTVTTTRYGSELGWIGMMLVSDDFRRRGIATQLIKASLDYLRQHQVRCIKLDATPTGLKVYQQLGFHAEWSFHRWVLEGQDSQSSTVLPQSVSPQTGSPQVDTHQADTSGDASKATGFVASDSDRVAFGADRRDWLERVAEGSLCCQHDNGFGMLREGFLANYLGPIVADTPEAARAIVGDLVSRQNRKVFWDVPQPNQDAVRLARSLGFQPIRDLTRMWTGPERVIPKIDLQYALCDPGTG